MLKMNRNYFKNMCKRYNQALPAKDDGVSQTTLNKLTVASWVR
jgi:hypothetical protein